LEKRPPQASTYVRNIENGKMEKKSWYQYVLLGVARQSAATWGGIIRRGLDAEFLHGIDGDQSVGAACGSECRSRAVDGLIDGGAAGDTEIRTPPSTIK
jgi:hypothetical protein